MRNLAMVSAVALGLSLGACDEEQKRGQAHGPEVYSEAHEDRGRASGRRTVAPLRLQQAGGAHRRAALARCRLRPFPRGRPGSGRLLRPGPAGGSARADRRTGRRDARHPEKRAGSNRRRPFRVRAGRHAAPRSRALPAAHGDVSCAARAIPRPGVWGAAGLDSVVTGSILAS